MTDERQPYLGDVIGELPPMRPIYRRVYTPPRWIERGVQVVIVWVFGMLISVLILIWLLLLFMFAAQPSLAQTQVPPACVVLAAREGQLIETEAQIRKARLKLYFMRGHDPLVRDCRAAIRRLKAETK